MGKKKHHQTACAHGLLHQFVIGTNADPFPLLPPTGGFHTLSTLTIAIDDPLDTVRFLATIVANNLGSTLTNLLPQSIQYRIRRVTPAGELLTVTDTNFDFVTTTFTVYDRPGVGFFTYILEGQVVNTVPGNDSNEFIEELVFTAEEIENNIPSC